MVGFQIQSTLFLRSSMKSGTPITAGRNVNAREMMAWEILTVLTRTNAMEMLSAFKMARGIFTASPQVL